MQCKCFVDKTICQIDNCKKGMTYQSNKQPPVFPFRVFVNRSLTLENIKCYGFDMDYTLAGECIYSAFGTSCQTV